MILRWWPGNLPEDSFWMGACFCSCCKAEPWDTLIMDEGGRKEWWIRKLHRWLHRATIALELWECWGTAGFPKRSQHLYNVSTKAPWLLHKSEPYASFLWHPKGSEWLPDLPCGQLSSRAWGEQREDTGEMLFCVLLILRWPQSSKAATEVWFYLQVLFYLLRSYSHSWQCSLLCLCHYIFTSSSPWKENREQMVPWAL